jgi:hypothetical protein
MTSRARRQQAIDALDPAVFKVMVSAASMVMPGCFRKQFYAGAVAVRIHRALFFITLSRGLASSGRITIVFRTHHALSRRLRQLV